MKTLKVRLTFTEPLLGTWPANQNVAREYIASKGPDAATIEDLSLIHISEPTRRS